MWAHTEQQRLDLADFLAALDPDQWERPSLCDGWRVRDVAAHVTLSARARPIQAMVGVIRAGGNFNKYVRRDAVIRAQRSREEIVEELRSVASARQRPPGTKTADPLVDILVHGQDIAIPLGIGRSMPTDAAVAAADRVWGMGFPFFAKWKFRGRRLVAANADWSRGEGETTEAPIEQILLLLTGRRFEG